MADQYHAITDAEKTIQDRHTKREATQQEFRGPIALELIADELTRLNAEVRTLRYLYASALVRPGR
jgi:hypothetical protein